MEQLALHRRYSDSPFTGMLWQFFSGTTRVSLLGVRAFFNCSLYKEKISFILSYLFTYIIYFHPICGSKLYPSAASANQILVTVGLEPYVTNT